MVGLFKQPLEFSSKWSYFSCLLNELAVGQHIRPFGSTPLPSPIFFDVIISVVKFCLNHYRYVSSGEPETEV